MSTDLRLVQLIDEHMTRPRLEATQGTHFYPSEASVEWEDKHGIKRVSGACLRASYYRLTAEPGRQKPDAYSEWIFALGKAVEGIITAQLKEMGLWVSNSLKFYDKERNISGELDIVIKDPTTGKLKILECKSFYGYNATRDIIGNKSVKGTPKTSHLLQTLVYVDQFKNTMDGAKLLYYARDSASRREFDVELVEQKGLHYPMVDSEIDLRFTMEDIYARYRLLGEYLANKELPMPDYQMKWDDEKVELRHDLGEVSKTAYEAWQKSKIRNPIGDWMCRYCSFKTVCRKL
jgi:hypothetical protein